MVRTGALVAAFVAAVLLPVAAASGASQLKLALLPLPRAALGQDGRSLSLAPDSGSDGHLILVPPGTMTELPAYGLDAVGRSFQLGGAPLLRAALENLLGVNLEHIDLIDDASLTALVAPAGALSVRVSSQVEQVEPSGRVTVLWPVGETQLAPADVPRFLAERGQQNDLARLVRHQAFWSAWLARLHAEPALLPRLAGLENVTPAIRALAKGSVQYSTLPVEAKMLLPEKSRSLIGEGPFVVGPG